ncbi:MAG: methyltransferase [Elusimicrobia bacterium RIFOXYA12_FULL_51_18]|nr:MAG: methyltransferase [Elusimicrobia bacterium RIFOXYA12_FULL_51_18]OGS32846.1 MAG: methyltransferase [Elusimicrobia bacterium RIFOXYA2_FULL_53_38]
MRCYICGGKKFGKRPGKVRDNSKLSVHECHSCGLVFLSSFSHITEKFYQNSKMHDTMPEVEAWCKTTRWDDERRFKFLASAMENRDLLDFGCGNGGFLVAAKAAAARAVGLELETRLTPHYESRGLKVFKALSEVDCKFDLITAFHVVEHLPDPAKELRRLACFLKKGGHLILEVPSSDDAMLKLYESEPFSHFTYWSCHLFLFNRDTLRLLADKAGLKVDYIKGIQRYPVSNHLHWLSKGLPGGHQKWSFLDSPELHAAYEKQLASLGLTDTVIASFSL